MGQVVIAVWAHVAIFKSIHVLCLACNVLIMFVVLTEGGNVGIVLKPTI